MNSINKCRICGCPNIKNILEMGKFPLANALIKDKEDPVEVYNQSLSWCPECNLVQLNETIPAEKLFSHYVWLTGTSASTLDYANIFLRNIERRINYLHKGYILEIASNDGSFLIPFYKNSYTVLGVEPATNIAKLAEKRGIPTINKFFDEDTAKFIVERQGKARVIIARNVIPHVENIHSVMKGISSCLEDDGLLVIEFHYAKIFNENLHLDAIYHEHLHYFTIKSIEYLLNKYGLYANDIEESPISGGSLVIYANKRRMESPKIKKYRDTEIRSNVNLYESWVDFGNRVLQFKENFLKILPKEKICAYGASARGLTLINFCSLNKDNIICIADRNPLKQDRIAPVSKIPIVSPEIMTRNNPNYILITAWNFADEIIKYLRKDFNYKGKFIIPFPEIKVI